MTPEATLRMAARQAWQGWRNGEFGVLMAALFVAVLALAGVGSIAQRTTDALAEQSRRLVGGDAAFTSDDRAIDAALADARTLGLRAYRSVELSSMVGSGNAAPQLGTLKALADDAPLLGAYRVRTVSGVQALPRPDAGTLWLSASGAERMRTPLGGIVEVGGRPLRLAGIVVEEPDRPLNGVELGPRVILPLAEVEAGGLLGPGARASWRIAVSGAPAAIAEWVKAREADRSPGARVETGDDLNPQLRAALDRAQRFLSVSLVLTAALAAVATGDRDRAAARLKAIAKLRCPFPAPADTQAVPILTAFVDGLNPRRAGKAVDKLAALARSATGVSRALAGSALRVVAMSAADQAYRAGKLAEARKHLATARAVEVRAGADELAYDLAVLDLADGKLDAARAGFASAQNDFMAVVEAEETLRAAELELEMARAELSRRQAALARAVGLVPGLPEGGAR